MDNWRLWSVKGKRATQWLLACEAWDFAIEPRFARDTLDAMAPGTLSFSATRTAVIDGVASAVKVDVVEVWREGPDPEGDWRLELDGCHLEVCSWHAQVGTDTGDTGADRLDVVAVENETHPRIHRHPYGQPNEVREPAGMAVPDGWLNQLNRILNGALDDAAVLWDELDA